MKLRPNVLWIFSDQQRAQALSCNGDANLQTPNLDRMSVNGTSFDRAVCGFPLCCPFRGSLLTSRYPHECVPGHEHPLPPDMPTVATELRRHGVHTAYFGKWHLDGFHERDGRAGLHIVPPGRRGGFDTWIGYENNNAQWDCHVCGGTGDETRQWKLDGYETDGLTDLLIDYLDQQARGHAAGQATPFFAVLSVQPPHNPYVAPAEWMARHNPATVQLRPNVPCIRGVEDRARRDLAGMYAMIENLDWNIGRILEALRRGGLDDNTHIVFFSDHGDMHGSHGQFLKTCPWEESIRVPFIVRGGDNPYAVCTGRPDVIPNHVDIAPTTLGLFGIETPDWMRGFDYSGWHRRDRPRGEAPDSAFLQSVIPTGHGDSVDRPWRGIVTRDGWKYVCLEHQPWLLFNLRDDPYEQANLAHNTRYGAERRRLQERLSRWIAETGDVFQLP